MEEIRINKYIASCGVCSRRSADDIILAGRVKVNGKIVVELGLKISSKDVVEVDGKQIFLEKDKKYIMLNKPKGFVTTSKEQFGRPSVLELLNVEQRVFPVGRLDMDTQGLLLLTNDGEFANKIIHPTQNIPKTYEVLLKKEITESEIELLRQGVDIGSYITRPAIVERRNYKNIIITIYEGKNRQVRKMCEAVNNKVINLKRVSVGGLELGDLKPSEYRLLNDEEIRKIFNKNK